MHAAGPHTPPAWRQPIAPARERLQARLLTAIMLPVLVLLAALSTFGFMVHRLGDAGYLLGLLFGVSLTFAIVVWALRAATPLAAVAGGLINFIVLIDTASFARPYDVQPYAQRVFASGMTPLLVLFALTFAATKAGRRRKARAGLAESRQGRNAAQVIANLGVAALAAGLYAANQAMSAARYHAYPVGFVPAAAMLLGVLAEATADTVSSEIGQAFGGRPILITTLQRVSPGTDGAVSTCGTLAGLAASALLVVAGALALRMPWDAALIAWLAGAAGLVFDSLLGATIERRGWLGNDLVNFSSTLFAGAVAFALRRAELVFWMMRRFDSLTR